MFNKSKTGMAEFLKTKNIKVLRSFSKNNYEPIAESKNRFFSSIQSKNMEKLKVYNQKIAKSLNAARQSFSFNKHKKLRKINVF